ncbi:hypothetical protein ACFFSY_05045 [Paenibacillus aurantiacus]|uniref:Hydrolase/acyltransferase n=1 Tax=Paenibacillus aurantiacus TaxID=1936118 RepID=A0ABV5KL20_9BACL
MEREQYYVSVSARTIGKEPSIAEQLTVYANEEELRELETLLDVEDKDDQLTHVRAVIPYKSAERDPATDRFSEHLEMLYAYIYKIGTPETKAHIESMDILPKLENQNHYLPGYK